VKETGETICSVEDPSDDPKYKGLTLEQDPDVLDTWFSSWLWPFSTLGWPEETGDLEHFFPSTTLVTGPDIIFLWVARMIMASEEVFGVAPFQHVYFTGMVRDMKGRKMSKSLGNSPDPIDVIDQYGADALRFTIVAQTPRGGDIRFEPALCELGRNFANKIWNASRFLLMNLPEDGDHFDFTPVDALESPPADRIDRWITSAFFSAVRDVTRSLDEFHFSEAVKRLQTFVWSDFCDWYIELLKARLQEGGASREAALKHAFGVLHGILRLAHPVMPFITEELYQTLRQLSGASWPSEHRIETILRAPYPPVREELIDRDVEQHFAELEGIVSAIRNIRGELGINPSDRIIAGVHSDSGKIAGELSDYAAYIVRLAGLETLEFDQPRPKGSASTVLGRMEVYVPLAGVVDVEGEKARLRKEEERLVKLAAGTQKKLANENFVSRAKPEVVENERRKLADAETALTKIRRVISELESI